MKAVIDILDLSKDEILELIDTAQDIIMDPDKYAHACDRKKLATLFFEPSTRTRMSFEAAMYELGGHVISMSSAGSSSAAKGESVADTAKTVSCYADIIAMRHPKEGAAYVAAMNASVPVINAGDGGHCHPTQTMADLLTIYREKGRFDHLTIGVCGDLKFGRTVHSLVGAMSRYEGNRFILISPEELKLPSYVKQEVLKDKKAEQLLAKAKDIKSIADAKAKGASVDSVSQITFSAPVFIASTGASEPSLSGAVAATAKGAFSKAPVKGNAGVYVFQVVDKVNRDVKYDAKAQEEKMRQRAMQYASQFTNELYRKANVTDNRYLFF